MKRAFIILLLSLAAPLYCFAGGDVVIDKDNCTITKDGKTFNLYGNVEIVNVGADIKVEIVNVGADIKAEIVKYGANDCGQFEIVNVGADIKVEIVNLGSDIKVEIVNLGSGMN